MSRKILPLSILNQGVQHAMKAHEVNTGLVLGTHVLGEFFQCKTLPNDVATIKEMMEEAARRIGATIVDSIFHHFNPWGLSGVVVISESHLAIHTWPEFQVANVDLFTCSQDLHPRIGFDFLQEAFGAEYVDVIELPRGAGFTMPGHLTGAAVNAHSHAEEPVLAGAAN